LIYNFFTSNFNSDDNRLTRILIILNTFLFVGTFIFLFFFIFNYFFLTNTNIAYLNILTASTTLYLLLDLRRNRNLNRTINITLITLFIFFISFVYLNQNEQFGLVWTPFFPIFSIVLLGVKKGSIVSFIYFSIVFTLAYAGIDTWENGEWSAISFLRLVISSLVLFAVIVTLEIALNNSYTKLEQLSTTDPLTKLYNRRKINHILEKEIHKAKRYKTQISLILFDIDDFKKINDTFGHDSGDNVLKQLSKSVSTQLRDTDSMARWGGEEFLIVIPMLGVHETSMIAEKLRVTIESIQCENMIHLSCSFGIAEFDAINDSIESFINKADLAMYKAKANGKNCVSS